MQRPTTRTRTVAVLVAAVLAVWAAVTLAAPGFSTAAFTSRTVSTGSVQAAADWTPPTVTTTDPGSQLKGVVTVSATASDATSGVATVAVQYYTSASGWTTICTATAAPWSCSWDTTKVADGSYALRSVATDGAGNQAVSASVSTTVANALLVVLQDPGDVVKGSVPLTTTVYGAGSTTYAVTVEYAVAGSGTWKTVSSCSKLASPYPCSWATTSLTAGYYDLRASATPTSGSTTPTYSTTLTSVLVDNAAPTVTTTDPGTPLAGTRTFAATADDADSGIASVEIQYQPSGASSWSTLCTLTSAPYSCSYDTTRLAGGSYLFRSMATDVAGNTTTSATVGPRTVDNTVSSVSLADPGAVLTGTVTLSASANSTAGIASVAIQRAPSGGSTWTTICTATTSPYQCAFDTRTVTDGTYDLRAVLVDGANKTTTSAVVSSRRVDNTALRGADVQTANGGTTAGRAENGDTITLRYTEQVQPGSILSGWSGAAQAVTVRLRDGGLLTPKLTGKDDTIDVLSGGTAVGLGSVNLKEDYVKGGQTVTFNATMTAATTTTGGVTATTVTIRLGTVLTNSGALKTAANPSTMVWTPSAAAKDLGGVACSTSPISETGAADKEL